MKSVARIQLALRRGVAVEVRSMMGNEIVLICIFAWNAGKNERDVRLLYYGHVARWEKNLFMNRNEDKKMM